MICMSTCCCSCLRRKRVRAIICSYLLLFEGGSFFFGFPFSHKRSLFFLRQGGKNGTRKKKELLTCTGAEETPPDSPSATKANRPHPDTP